ncbi:exopolysaccharide biosynthesis polyprenyl glycosylphosphotransferase [Streptomyces sp. N2-109]|uniref:Exopolysaccharide biosynthesis polyprenyl glycosylphosphotransferase n=1 Tax=Streptomyces gossypii TaxID=2883101 RepID=A0ABT2JQF3_9ACTN|nr:exopolysaccharide biosynthesis polyprenyl glycosylphosphotransferase [Streptomyces gossypii]MCT2590123.1 exopolysaccharide biosynthesis polyprenyl glycosylphosphotransferase [Streptomyces gossypii]
MEEPEIPAGPGRELPPIRDKAVWYVPLALATDVMGTGLPVLFVFLATGRPHPVLAAVTATAVWTAVQLARKRYSTRSLGEARGLLSATQDWLTLVGLLAVIRVATSESSAPAHALLALTPALVLTAACRALTHHHLGGQRRAAQSVCRALVVGEAHPVDEVVGQLAARTDHAYVVIGAVAVGETELRSGVPEFGRLTGRRPSAPRAAPPTASPAARPSPAPANGPAEEPAGDGRGLPPHSEITLNLSIAAHCGPGRQDDGSAVLDAAQRLGAEVVLIVPGARLTGERLRQLSWAVQDAGLPLVIASGLTEVALRRVRLATAAGLNLLHISPPVRRGPQLAFKNVLDRVGAGLGLLLLAPLFALLTLAVRLDSKGPVFHRQARIGQRGTPFRMWKFRSMVADAELLRPRLAAADEQDGPAFKIRRDPRVTRVGRLLRRSSLDELPQLVNVLRGEMSLVGPRPPLPDEVAAYNAVELRRLGVKPGMTGPWQVGGRSDLSWDESLALDLRYADNWSLTTDMDVLARTFRAVVDGRGAY